MTNIDDFATQLRNTADPTANGAVPTPPAGYRWWCPDDARVPDPVLARAAYIGPVGAYLDVLDGQTEAHPAAVGIQVLAACGTIIGRRACYRAGRVVHHCNLFVTVLGPSSEGAKTVADAEAFDLVHQVDPTFQRVHGWGGLGSGEVLIRTLRDDAETVAERNRLIHDAELSSVLRVVGRQGSILGDVIRKAFDYGPLRHETVEHGAVVATGHHIAIVGSITPEEHRELVGDTAVVNGFANRFLYVWSRLTRRLPNGGDVDHAAVAMIADDIRGALDALARRADGERHLTWRLRLDPDATALWEAFYEERRTGIGEGVAKALTARQVAHAARLAVIYATLDGVPVIQARHIGAAIAWCDYSARSIDKAIAGHVSGKAGQLLNAVRDAMPAGLTGTEAHSRVGHNWPAGALTAARDELVSRHLVAVERVPSGGGRPSERYYAITPSGVGQEGSK